MKNSHIIAQTELLIDQAAQKLSLSLEVLAMLKSPYREVKVDLPVKDSATATLNIYQGYRIQHNGARGPYYGGVAFDSDLNAEYIDSLAKRTSLKTALMNIPFGGAYGGIALAPDQTDKNVLEAVVRKYTDKLTALIGPYKDILAQGSSSDHKIMACIMDEYSKRAAYSQAVATGKPEALGGTVGRKTVLVSSAYYCCDIVARSMQMQLPGLSMALSVGWEQAISFIENLDYLGCHLIALCVDDKCLYNLDESIFPEIIQHLSEKHTLEGCSGAEPLVPETFLTLDTDILLLGNDSMLITRENASCINAQLLVELCDGLICFESEAILFEKGVTVVPDLLVSSGIAALDYFEWIQNIQQFRWSYDQVNEEMANHINEAFKVIREFSESYQVSYRLACYMVGLARLAEATAMRGYA